MRQHFARMLIALVLLGISAGSVVADDALVVHEPTLVGSLSNPAKPGTTPGVGNAEITYLGYSSEVKADESYTVTFAVRVKKNRVAAPYVVDTFDFGVVYDEDELLRHAEAHLVVDGEILQEVEIYAGDTKAFEVVKVYEGVFDSNVVGWTGGYDAYWYEPFDDEDWERLQAQFDSAQASQGSTTSTPVS